MARSGQHAGPGMVIIIPAVEGCECDYRCLAMDVHRSQVVCICPKGWMLGQNGKSCIGKALLKIVFYPRNNIFIFLAEATEDDFYPKTMITLLLIIIIVLILGFGTLCITLCKLNLVFENFLFNKNVKDIKIMLIFCFFQITDINKDLLESLGEKCFQVQTYH